MPSPIAERRKGFFFAAFFAPLLPAPSAARALAALLAGACLWASPAASAAEAQPPAASLAALAPVARPAYFAVQCVEFEASPLAGESPRALWEKAASALKISTLPPGAGQREAGVWVGTVARASVRELLDRLSAAGSARVAFSQSQTRRPRTPMRFSGEGLAAGESLEISGAGRGARALALSWRFSPGRSNSRVFATRGFATLASPRSFVIAYARDGALRLMVLSAAPSASLSPLAVW